MPSQIYKHYDGLQLNPTLFATQHHHLPQTSPTTYHHSTTISLTHHYNTTTSSLANHFAFAFTNHFPQIPPPGTTSCPTPLYTLRRGSPRPPHPPGTHHARDRAATPARDSPYAGQGRHTRQGLAARGTGTHQGTHQPLRTLGTVTKKCVTQEQRCAISPGGLPNTPEPYMW